jgi:hypothetical protein
MSARRWLLATGLMSISALANAASTEQAESGPKPAAPPPKCEIRQPAWCIYQGASEIVRRFDEKTRDVVWILSGVPRPDSQLVVFEPHGCREGFADTVTSTGFEENFEWQHKSWDRVRVRLKADGSCDLTLLVPLFSNDPMEWAFSTGRGLIAACKDERCLPSAPTPADVTDKYRKQFRREKESPN